MARDREKDELSSPELSSWEGNSEFQDIIIQKVLARCQTLLDKEPVLFTNIYQDAWELVTRARHKAEELGLAVVITVVDPAAQVVMTYRMENALLVSNDMAYKKAYTAVGMRKPTKSGVSPGVISPCVIIKSAKMKKKVATISLSRLNAGF